MTTTIEPRVVGNFTFTPTFIDGVVIVEPHVFGDARGCFFESYKKIDFDSAGLDYDFIQDNHSISAKGALRGLHYQKEFPQAKLVRVIQGEVFDVAVDLRKTSPTLGKWVGVNLSAENKRQLMIPRGFAHGFLVLSDKAEFVYKCDEVYHPNDEGGILWNDPSLGVAWPTTEDAKLILSDKDKKHPTYLDYLAEGKCGGGNL